MSILGSWKEIAAYMGHGVRTVQRWEGLGLPIHRPKLHKRSHVIALSEEIDAWVSATPKAATEEIAALKQRVAELEAEVASLRSAAIPAKAAKRAA